MGRRGPRPEPTALKIERGNPGHRALNDEEPALPELASTAPDDLAGDALAEWDRLYALLTDRGVLTEGDRAVFTTYCRLFGQVRAYERKVAEVGLEDAHKLGYFGGLMKLRAQLKQYAAELGLTPSSRSGVKTGKKVTRETEAEAKHRRFFGTKQA